MTARTPLHVVGDFQLQNNPDCAKFTPPTQVRTLRVSERQECILDTEEAVVWQYDPELELPVVASHKYYIEMFQTYDDPDKNSGGDTIVFPMQFTEDAYGGGHPHVNFSRDDTLAFFTSEAVLTSDFPRLFVGSFNDFEQSAREEGRGQVIWGKTYRRPAFAPGNEQYVREVFVIPPGGKPVRKTRPASEGWVPMQTLIEQDDRDGFGPPPTPLTTADD